MKHLLSLTEATTKGFDRFSVYLIMLDIVIFISAYFILYKL